MFANLVYLLALLVISPIVAYRFVRWGRYRRGFREKFLGLSSSKANRLRPNSSSSKVLRTDQMLEADCVWIHGVSVGEINLLPRVVETLRRDTGLRVVVSSSTDSGYDLACKLFGEDRTFFCPFDFTWAVRRTLNLLKPRMLILTELELWPNLIRTASDQGVPVLVINGRMSARSGERYRRFGNLTREIFSRLTWVGIQDEASREQFMACGAAPERLTVTGSIKFDNITTSRDNPEVQKRAFWAGVDPWHRVWVVGSTQPGEDEMALDVFQSLKGTYPELRLIIIPRHAERFQSVANEIRRRGLAVHLRSKDESMDQTTWEQDRVILVDTIGELKHWWGVGQIATVGGSFGDRGGQNMLEPAGFGAAVSFGPDTRNFAEIATQLLELGAAIRVHDSMELRRFVDACLSDPVTADQMGLSAQTLVKSHRGATTKTISHIRSLLTPQSQRHKAA
jgi:3-deoxy-D-manno-octulosonic-acid transferase